MALRLGNVKYLGIASCSIPFLVQMWNLNLRKLQIPFPPPPPPVSTDHVVRAESKGEAQCLTLLQCSTTTSYPNNRATARVIIKNPNQN